MRHKGCAKGLPPLSMSLIPYYSQEKIQEILTNKPKATNELFPKRSGRQGKETEYACNLPR